MTAAQKRGTQALHPPAPPSGEAGTATPAARKAWKKKTPTEVVLDQINRVREDVEKKEEELKQAKRQLEKLEGAKKLLESN